MASTIPRTAGRGEDRPRGHGLTGLRRLNQDTVRRTLHRGGPRTIAQLAGDTGLSRPTVEALVEELVRAEQVAETTAADQATRRPGRPARRYRFRAESAHVLGVDVGLHKLVMLRVDLDGDTVDSDRVDLDPQLTAAERLDLLRAHLLQFIQRQGGVDQGRVAATCVAVPGYVEDGGRVTSTVIPEWTGMTVSTQLNTAIPGALLIENDVNMAAVAEHWCGTATLADDVACLLAGRRVSSGLLLGGRLHRGHRGSAGELGSLPVLGLYDAHRALHWPDAESAPVEALAAAVEQSDPAATDALRRYAAALAPGVAALLLSVDPELLVLSGGITPIAEPLIPFLEEELRPITRHLPRIAVSALGDQGVALGAARTALDRVHHDLGLG